MTGELSPGVVEVWTASLDRPASDVARLGAVLSEDESRRAARFYFERDRQAFVVARGVLRTILGGYLGIEPTRVVFAYGVRGKPELATASAVGEPGVGLTFNLAHTRGLAVYGVSRGAAIGVDVERVRAVPDAEQIAATVFTERERARLRALPPELRATGFFHAWTRKEAYVKATGDGLTEDLREIDVGLGPLDPNRRLRVGGDLDAGARWTIRDLAPAPGYLAAICLEGSVERLTVRRWPGGAVGGSDAGQPPLNRISTGP